jgi:signal transduction histidine kinase
LIDSAALSEIVKGLDPAYVATDQSGTVVALSPTAATLLGMRDGDAVGRHAGDVIDAGAIDGVAVLSGPDSMLWRCLSGGEAWQTPLRGTDIVVAGEPKPVNLRICRLEGGGALISLFDAAPLRDVLEAHDALISITSHELKTPLTAIKAMSELMLAYDLGEDQQKEMIGDIHHQAERLEQLIREILDASQIDSGRTQLVLHDVDLKELFAEVADELETQLQGRGSAPTTRSSAKLGSTFLPMR